MLVLNRAKLPLGLCLILGGAALLLWAGKLPAETGATLGLSLAQMELWLMMGITVLVLEFGRFMTEPHNSEEILKVFRRIGGKHGRSLSLMGAPAVVGLIPMPAGALFSAPLVGDSVKQGDWPSEWKAAVNYWFRHIWEYWWPLYPGVIVAMPLFAIETWQFFAVQIPFTLTAVFSGWFFLIRPNVKILSTGNSDKEKGNAKRTIAALSPLIVVVAGVLIIPSILGIIAPDLSSQNRTMTAMLIGLLAGLLVIVHEDRRRENCKRTFKTLLEKKSLYILLTISGVMIFKHCLDSSGLILAASNEIGDQRMGMVSVVAGLPFLAGMITGVAVGFTGVSFPFIVGLTAVEGSGMGPLATLALAYGCGYMGMMLSPVHLCLLVTKDYFESSILRIIPTILPCVLAILAYAVGGHMLFRALGW